MRFACLIHHASVKSIQDRLFAGCFGAVVGAVGDSVVVGDDTIGYCGCKLFAVGRGHNLTLFGGIGDESHFDQNGRTGGFAQDRETMTAQATIVGTGMTNEIALDLKC